MVFNRKGTTRVHSLRNMNKKLLIIIVALLLVFIGLSVYVFFLRGGGDTVVDNTLPPEVLVVSENSANPNAPLVQIATGVVIHTQSTSNEELVVVLGNGTVRKITPLGAVLEEKALGLSPITKADVSPNGERVVFQVYNTTSQRGRWYVWEWETEQVPNLLPGNVRDASFSPQNTLLWTETGDDDLTSRLVLESGASTITLLTTHIPDVVARWIDENTLVLYPAPSGSAPGVVYQFNIRSRSLVQVISSRLGVSAAGSGANYPLLFTEAVTASRLVSGIHDGTSAQRIPYVTLPERCTSSRIEGELYCSTLSSQAKATLMPDDYYKGVVVNSTSGIIRVDLDTDSAIELSRLPFDAGQLTLSEDGLYVFAIDKNSGSLWRVRLESSL